MVDGASDLPKEAKELQRYFTKVLELPEKKLMESQREWAKRSVFARSLSWRVPMDWVAWEFKLRKNIQADPNCFTLVKDHHLFRFQMEDCNKILDRACSLSLANCWRWIHGSRILSQLKKGGPVYGHLGSATWTAYEILGARFIAWHCI